MKNTNDKINDYNLLSPEEINKKTNFANTVFNKWKNLTTEERVQFIPKLITVLESDRQELAEMITSEMGKPIKQSLAEIDKCALLCNYYYQNAVTFLKPKRIDSDASESFITYEPLGVILGVMPWNYPFWQVFRFVIPTILAGNTTLLKHASNVKGSASLIERTFLKAGFPEGVFQNLIISSGQVESIIENPYVRAVSLTGSEGAGAAVAKAAGKHLKKAVLELGGSNAFIVYEDADIKKAVAVAVNARMQNAGQSCIAAKRFLVHKNIEKTFIEQFSTAVSAMKIGDPFHPDTEIGPMARLDLAEELEKQIIASVAAGAEIILGGKRKGAFYEPTIILNVTPNMPVFKEETFGPVAAITCFSTLEEAIALSNASAFGLGVSIFSKNSKAIQEKIHLFNEGAVFINEMVKSDPRLPFGGIKKSGYGRELSEEGIKEFVNVKTVYIK